MATLQSVQQHQQQPQSGDGPNKTIEASSPRDSKVHKALAVSAVPSLIASAKVLSNTANVIRNSLGLAPLSPSAKNNKSVIRIRLSRQSSNETFHDATTKPLPPTPSASSSAEETVTTVESSITEHASEHLQPLPQPQPQPRPMTTNINDSTTKYPMTIHSLLQLYDYAATLSDAEDQLQHVQYIITAIEGLPELDGEDDKRHLKRLQACTRWLLKRLASSRGYAKPGYAPAQLYLGNCYGEGKCGFEANAGKAFQCYWMGSKQNHAECMYRVAVCYEFGAGTRLDVMQAAHYLRKAARTGFLPAMYKLGMVLIHRETPLDRRQGISWLKRAIQHDTNTTPAVLHALALACETPGYALVPDPGYALELYHQAAAFGHAPSQARLATAYETGDLGCPVDNDQALLWAEQAAAQGDAEAAFCLSRWCLSQNTNDQAYQWAEQAAYGGSARAMLAMAYYKEYGVGTEKNIEESRLWLYRAAEHNDEYALERIRELKKQERDQNSQHHHCHIM
ncbi:chitin synthase activator [Lichtheimia corymbifera JMRC:FSU:9682]|uniref:Chitin synthase activator n=1 Tax=Lichtheimia corymbifera JMRC:FSU:9682 TaxID=1263082 RepID=A0A068RST0_9FUNG|nr:chitin synthase activator [Lichtheimia corymbifera JMRC:FSU:9682]